jgi:hypothetical protein
MKNSKRNKKTKNQEFIKTLIQNQKCKIKDKPTQINNLQKELIALNDKWQHCYGPHDVLKSKLIYKQINSIKSKLKFLQNSKQQKKEIFKIMEQNDTMETTRQKFQDNDISTKLKNQMNTKDRLYPPIPQTSVMLFDRMNIRKIQKWQGLRALKKRHALINNDNLPPKNYNIDFCQSCNVDKIVNRESARSICPKCGDSVSFASHVLDIKDNDKVKSTKTKQQSCLNWMQKGSVQHERGHPMAPNSVIETACLKYNHIHNHDPNKVQPVATRAFFKKCPSVPKEFKCASDRITRELKAQSIPEFTSEQINYLLNQRNRLRAPDEQGKINAEFCDSSKSSSSKKQKHTKKSFTNNIYMRQFGLMCGLENSRLFPQAKTNKIHLDRCRSLEKQCELQKKNPLNKKWTWDFKPFS